MKKINTNHPFTKAQLAALNKELSKISNSKIVKGLKGAKIPSKSNYIDIEIKHSPFDLMVFLEFTDITDTQYPFTEVYGIDIKGNVDYNVRSSLEFDTLTERVNYFSSLKPIKIW